MVPKSDAKKMLVMKFGGTSVGSAKALAQAMDIVESNRPNWTHMVVLVSALSGTTNLLLDSAIEAARGKKDAYLKAEAELRSRHMAMAEAFLSPGDRQEKFRVAMDGLINEFSRFCQAITVLGEATPRALDAVAGLGERLSARLFASALQ